MALNESLYIIIFFSLNFITFINAIEGINSYFSKNPIILEIHAVLHKLELNDTNIMICWILAHVGILGNEEADKAAKEAVNSPRATDRLPYSDYKSKIQEIIRKKWQQTWSAIPLTNKLRKIKDNSCRWLSSLQKERLHEVVLTRLRIGHTKLTHGYLMNTPHDPAPICDACLVPITVTHIMIECAKYNLIRPRYFRNNTLKGILAEGEHFSSDLIFRFLRNCGLLSKI